MLANFLALGKGLRAEISCQDFWAKTFLKFAKGFLYLSTRARGKSISKPNMTDIGTDIDMRFFKKTFFEISWQILRPNNPAICGNFRGFLGRFAKICQDLEDHGATERP